MFTIKPSLHSQKMGFIVQIRYIIFFVCMDLYICSTLDCLYWTCRVRYFTTNHTSIKNKRTQTHSQSASVRPSNSQIASWHQARSQDGVYETNQRHVDNLCGSMVPNVSILMTRSRVEYLVGPIFEMSFSKLVLIFVRVTDIK